MTYPLNRIMLSKKFVFMNICSTVPRGIFSSAFNDPLVGFRLARVCHYTRFHLSIYVGSTKRALCLEDNYIGARLATVLTRIMLCFLERFYKHRNDLWWPNYMITFS